MKTKIIGAAAALAMAITPLTAIAEGGVGGGNANSNWTIYGWQNWSLEFVDVDTTSIDPTDTANAGSATGFERSREFSRINNNAANIGFAASIDTGVSVGGQAVKANFQCEQFTFHNRFNGFSDFCNRNSKIGLSGPWGEVMWGQWLLPYNEMVAAWVDPFYDAGATSHTSIMGNIGNQDGGNFFYNGSFGASDSFNRRQEEIIQWFSPNWNGFTARIATTNANGLDESQVLDANGAVSELDPRIWSAGIAYTTDIGNSNLWGAITYQKHDEWRGIQDGCSDTDDESYRVAARYIGNFGSGFGLTLSAMYEQLEYDSDDCAVGGALAGTGDLERDAWMVSGKLNFAGPLDFRFSYMDGDDWDCSGGIACGLDGTDGGTDADAFNVGLFYTMPAGTELRLTYSEVSNGNQSTYDYGIGGAGTVTGGDNEHIGLGIVQWF